MFVETRVFGARLRRFNLLLNEWLFIMPHFASPYEWLFIMPHLDDEAKGITEMSKFLSFAML